jgi:hypothetical protein
MVVNSIAVDVYYPRLGTHYLSKIIKKKIKGM